MINIALALKKRLNRFIRATSITTAPISVGDDTVTIRTADAMFFDIVRHYKSRPQIVVYDPSDSSGFVSFHRLHAVNRDTGELSVTPSFSTPYSSGVRVTRAPGQQVFTRIITGDITQNYELPAIIIKPDHVSREWMTLPTGSDEKFDFQISVAVQDQGNEESELACMAATQEVDDLLMADLHLRVPSQPEDQSDRVYNSLVTDIDFGYVQRGTAFIKVATLSWFCSQYIIRLVARDVSEFDYFNYYPGDQYGAGGQGFETDDQNRESGLYTHINDY